MHRHAKWIEDSVRKHHKVSYSMLKSLRTLHTKFLVMAIAMTHFVTSTKKGKNLMVARSDTIMPFIFSFF